MITNTEERKKREELCKSCPSNLMGLCRKCGCFIVVKVRLASEECPAKKWEIVNA